MLKHLILAAAFLFPALAWPSVSVTVNGVSYTIPQTNERNWGTNVTSWIQAISSNTLQPSGGTFTLGADIDFGASFGLKSTYYKTRTANVSSTGQWRLADTDGIGFRNHVNGGDLLLAKDTSDNLTWNGHPFLSSSGILPVAAGGTGIGSGTSGGVLAFTASGTIASSGALTASQVVIGGGAGAAPSALAAGSQFQSLIMGASAPGYGAVNLAQAAATTGQLPTASGGTGQNSSATFPTSGTVFAGTPSNHGMLISSGTGTVTVLAPDASTTKVWTSGGSSADPAWQTPTAAPTQGDNLINLGLSATISSNTLVISLKQSDGSTDCGAGAAACKIGFRDPTATNGDYQTTSFTAASSITLASTASLGNPTGAGSSYFIYAIQDTTSELCVANTDSLDQGALTSATATPATTAGTLYCTNAHTSRPIRLIGRVTDTWSNPIHSAISSLVIWPFSDRCATTSSTFTWNGSGSTTGSLSLVACRHGDWVSLFIPICQATSGTSSTALSSNTALPTWAWPLTATAAQPTNALRNSGGDTHAGLLQIGTGGILQIFRDNASTAFSNGVNAGISAPSSYTYYVGNGS